METLTSKCSQCNLELGRFINLWTQIGKSYVTPIVTPGESRAITTKGPSRVGDQNTLVSGCELQDIVCTGCDSVLGLKCSSAPVNHVLEDNQLLLRLASVRLTNTKSRREAKLVIRRHLKLKDPAAKPERGDPAGADASGPHVNGDGNFMPPQGHQADRQPQFDPINLTGLQAYLESQRADISRIDSAGYQIVAAFDNAMDRVEREVKKLQDTMATLRGDLDGNRDDVSSLKTSVDAVRKDSVAASTEAKSLRSELEGLRRSAPISDTIDELRSQLQDSMAKLHQSSLDRASEANDLRRELTLTKAELHRAKSDQATLKTQVDGLRKAPKENLAAKDYAREVSALRLEVRQLRQETAQKPPSHAQAQNGSFAAKELDILTRNIAKIGNRASQIETLQMEFQLFRSRLQRLEAAESSAPPAPPVRDKYDLPPFSDAEAEQHQNSSAKPSASAQRRKRSSAGREKIDEDSTPNKRLAFSSDVEGEDSEFGVLDIPETPPSRGTARGRGATRGGTQAAISRATGRKVRGRTRGSLPGG
ncbi:uncharacterized protein DNG_06934 [Cephalotrichum gorgonifer]|uniref:Yippee/Mis18/Cereblon domain-containing protein n=1 Tax=Cephalotrichum gorgonifer TaxID=2041049 RepID=A0AAE8N0K2_9PEZI|nr:uncharacterized protein DNG_06934 [Cephalotrichum gorgonifer]